MARTEFSHGFGTQRRTPISLRTVSALVALALTVTLTPFGAAQARIFFDSADPALNGATIVPLDATRFFPGQRSALLVENGHEFQFDTAAAGGFFTDTAFGPPGRFVTFFPDGVEIAIAPGVGAIGFQFDFAECAGAIEIVGTAATESFTFPFQASNRFVGAADIGDIERVVLNGACFAAVWSEMRFVPASGGPPPDAVADLAASKTGRGIASQLDGTLDYELSANNLGPDTASNTQVVDFLPPGTTLVGSNPAAVLSADGRASTQSLGDVATGSTAAGMLSTTIPPFSNAPVGGAVFNCDAPVINVEIATSGSIDPNGSNNVTTWLTGFDRASRAGTPEICDNGIDDNCNLRVDCGDFGCSGAPNCRPPVMVNAQANPPIQCPFVPGSPCLNPDPGDDPFQGFPEPLDPDDFSPPQHCEIRDVHGNRQVIALCCCSGECNRNAFKCRPKDPNFKQADPPVNFFGYGYTDAGRPHTYSITYENIGGVAANDVRIVDLLSTHLDDSTLLVNDGGVYDPATRTTVWTDAVVLTADPRTVSFEVDVRADAVPGTRIRDTATIIFPDALPPSRIDTNFVEHSIVDPAFPVIVDPGVIQCVPAGAGNQWTVSVFNKGFAYGFNATATILNPPAPVQVTDGTVALGSMDDPAGINSMVALGTTNGVDTVAFTTTTPGDPCRALTWRISYEEKPGGPVTTVEVQVDPDGDDDAVRDQGDNCPVDFNPTQADSNGDGIGDACTPQVPIDDLIARAKSGKISLVWAPVAEAVSYNVYRATTSGGPYQSVAQGHVSGFATFLDTGLTNGTTYFHVVRWVDVGGSESDDSNEASATPRAGRRR